MDLDLTLDLSSVPKPPEPVGKRRYLLKAVEDRHHEFVLQIDNSSMEVFDTCPRSSQFSLVFSRTNRPSPALTYGGAFHDALETYYKLPNKYQRPLPEESLLKVLESTAYEFSLNPPQMGEWRTEDRCHEELTRYINHYPTEPFKLLELNGEPCVELPFSLPLGVIEQPDVLETEYTWDEIVDPDTWPNESVAPAKVAFKKIHVYWTGKIDLAVSMDGGNWIVDHKTTSMLGPTFYDHFKLSSQTIGYTWAGRQIFNERFNGLMVNVIANRKKTRTGTGSSFERQRFYYRDDQVEEWKENTLHRVSDFIANLARDYFPMSPAWCMGKYGRCKYHSVCTLPPNQRYDALHSDEFANNTWTPLK